MLRVILAFALLYVVSGQPRPDAPYTSQSGQAYVAPASGSYNQGGYGRSYADPIIQEINDIIRNISVLASNDATIDARIRSQMAQNAANSAVTERFQNEIFPAFRKAQAQQNDDITELEEQATVLIRVSDDVAVIASTVAQIQSQLAEIEAVRTSDLRPRIAALQAADEEQDARIENVNNGIDQQEANIEEIYRRSVAVRDRITKMRQTLHEIFAVFNSEGAETFEVVLTSEEPEVTKCLSETFDGRVPNYQYGFTGIHVTDHTQTSPAPTYGPRPYGYSAGSSYSYHSVEQVQDNPNINFDVDVDYDAGTNKFTARLYDISDNGWAVEKIVVRVVFYRVDNRIISTY